MRRLYLALVVVLGCVPDCSSSPPPADGGADAATDGSTLDGLCPTQHTEPFAGGTWVVCDELYSTAPFIRPPADTTTSVYVGFKLVIPDGGSPVFQMWGRGQTWPEPSSFSSVIEGSATNPSPYGSTLYQATLAGSTVTGLVPVARIAESLFLQPFQGAVVEGALSPRVVAADGGVSFDFQNLDVPVRIQLASAVVPADAGTLNHPFLPATIENVDGGVYASTGACMPSLTSLEGGSPVFGESDPGALTFYRVTNMHGNHDDVIVMLWSLQSLGNTMSHGGYISVGDLLQSSQFDL